MAKRASRKRPVLTEEDWIRVFKARCRSKEGRGLSDAELDLCRSAMEADGERYAQMSDAVFEATKPFGAR